MRQTHGVLIILLMCWLTPTPWLQAGQRAHVPDQEYNGTSRNRPVTNITAFFEMLPDECFFAPAPGQEQRRELLEGGSVNGMKVGVKDIRNGYMNLTGAFNGVWEMCFWNTMDGGKLVAVNVRICGPACTTHLFFYRMGDDGGLVSDPAMRSALERQLGPEDFYQTERMGPRELAAIGNPAQHIIYELPRLGRNIVIRRDENASPGNGIPETLLRPLRDVLFIWDGTDFTKQP